jgi:serine/threonine protein phosphatase PrpC
MKCDENLNKSEIDLSLSGCTALFIFFTKGNLYMASIGDSRAVLATEVVPEVLPVKEADSNNTEILDEIKEQRKLPSTLYSIQLTKDQKPEHPEECARISDCGGRVQQLLDRNGMKIGPYRVFDLKGNQPGLAMSRSLGDLLGKKVGVISTPAFTKYKFHKETDSFLVIASDGIWDVMDNQEVVNFVETFRTKCLKEIELPFIVTETITPSNVSISQLLCEEARTRWCTIVENENVMIDDISCIVLEFNQKVSAHANEIKYYAQGTSKGEQVSDVRRATSIHEIKTRDPRRGSFCVSK